MHIYHTMLIWGDYNNNIVKILLTKSIAADGETFKYFRDNSIYGVQNIAPFLQNYAI